MQLNFSDCVGGALFGVLVGGLAVLSTLVVYGVASVLADIGDWIRALPDVARAALLAGLLLGCALIGGLVCPAVHP